ncbi:oxygenase MpaB family protein [Massilia sp. ST3]|uniref:oxygenase MpaB family protein n=1 Tax=Massilia sp. ST3 TaxID=2824903 RepID=UPI001B831EF0|nr:oxygenase MpaB family protein [Massilia sp. ST3]MBQ5950295.1 DUF2236 domain-containing protein [Massilia sp. ST3]
MKPDAAQLLDPALVNPALRADPLADGAVARMLGDSACNPARLFPRIAVINAELARWDTNGSLAGWRALPGTDPEIAAALEDYVQRAMRLPDWADKDCIARAEKLFMDMSMLSCTLLFCTSLPECYILPDLSAVLQAAGQLELHTDYRVRSTAAMIFPVMMRGGMTDAAGGGIAQALKVRLIHATIRHLILRGAPGSLPAGAPVAPIAPAGPGMHHTLYAHGWDGKRDGLPCNQEELAYTLLTFHYAFLRGLRRLGLGLPREDEQAYLHAWNVLGHLIGIERELMAWTMEEADARFQAMQARGRAAWSARLAADPGEADPRPPLAAALMQAMANELPLRVLKPFPILLTRYLCGKQASRDLGLTRRVSLISRALFALGLGTVRLIDAVVRIFVPGFSISRLLTRVAGYRLTTRFLMDQTRPLKLPDALLGQVDQVMQDWRQDPKAPAFMKRIEAHLVRSASATPPAASAPQPGNRQA